MPPSSSTAKPTPAKAESGKKHQFTPIKGFSFLILYPEQFAFQPEDMFILKSSSGSYESSTTFAQADVNEHLCVLWFDSLPEEDAYTLQVQPKEGDEFYWFENESLSPNREAESYQESNKKLRSS